MYKNIRNILAFLFLSFLFSSCSKDTLSGLFVGSDQEVQVVEREVHAENFEVISVVKGRNSLDEPYVHPVALTEEMVLSVLKGISFQTREYSQYIKVEKSEWSVPEKLFGGPDLPQLAAGIAKVFSQLNSKEEVYFYIDSEHSIEGKTYITRDGWYWFFRAVDGKGPKDDRVSTIKEWKIALEAGENYIVTHDRYQLKNLHVNWVVKPLPEGVSRIMQKENTYKSEKDVNNYRLQEEYPDQEGPESTKEQLPARQRQNTEVIDKKLLILNKLKEDGIITEEEFQIKVQEILRNEL